jgi:hypothetical protein
MSKADRIEAYHFEVKTAIEKAVREADPLGLMNQRDLKRFVEREYSKRVPDVFEMAATCGPLCGFAVN